MDQPLVSVGIPTYNNPEGLRKALECVTRQTYKNLEIIVSDNCSPGQETTAVVCEFRMRDNRIQYYRQDANNGALFNFRFVLEKAIGEYFMWVADDDEWETNSITTFVREFDRNSEISAVMSACKRVDENGLLYDIVCNFNSKLDPNLTNPLFLSLDASTNYYWTYLIYGLFRTDYLKRTFKFTPSVFGSDVLFICHVLMSAKISYIDNVHYIRKVHKQGTAERYVDEEIGMQYSDPLKFYKMILSLGPYLIKSNSIPVMHKIWVPLIVSYMVLFQVVTDVKGIILCLTSILKIKVIEPESGTENSMKRKT